MPVAAQLAQVIAELSMISHVPAVNLEPHLSTEEDIGGRKPPGGTNHSDDRDPDIWVKSAEHFQIRMAGCRTSRDLELVLVDARRALQAFKRSPAVPGKDPEYGSVHWKRMIANSTESDDELSRKHGCSRAMIHKVKRLYAGT